MLLCLTAIRIDYHNSFQGGYNGSFKQSYNEAVTI